MRLAIALGLTLWAGCFSDRGLALEVDVGNLLATSVELYVGNEPCADSNAAGINCKAGLEPPVNDLTHRLTGTVWFRHDPVPYTAQVHGHTATFRLQADDTAVLPIVVVVGIAGNERIGTSTLHDVEVPAGDGRVVTTTLKKATSIFPDRSTAGDEERVATWIEPADPNHSCVAIEHWSGGNVTRDFIVPADDPDCDGVTDEAKECDPAVYLATNVAGDGPPSCFAGNAGEACTLGAAPCTDGVGEAAGCLARADRICVPERFCECDGDQRASTCARDLTPGLTVPHVKCTVHVDASGKACEAVTATPIDFGNHFPDGDCRPIALLPLALNALSGKPATSFDGVQLELIDDHAPCSFNVHAKPSERTDAAAVAFGLIRLEQRASSLLVPIVFNFSPPAPCVLPGPEAMVCEHIAVDSDPMWTCGGGAGRR